MSYLMDIIVSFVSEVVLLEMHLEFTTFDITAIKNKISHACCFSRCQL